MPSSFTSIFFHSQTHACSQNRTKYLLEWEGLLAETNSSYAHLSNHRLWFRFLCSNSAVSFYFSFVLGQGMKSGSYPKLPLNQLNHSFLHPHSHTHTQAWASKRMLNARTPQRQHSAVEKSAWEWSRAPRPNSGWTLLLSEQIIPGAFTPHTLLCAQITVQHCIHNDLDRPAHLATHTGNVTGYSKQPKGDKQDFDTREKHAGKRE